MTGRTRATCFRPVFFTAGTPWKTSHARSFGVRSGVGLQACPVGEAHPVDTIDMEVRPTADADEGLLQRSTFSCLSLWPGAGHLDRPGGPSYLKSCDGTAASAIWSGTIRAALIDVTLSIFCISPSTTK